MRDFVELIKDIWDFLKVRKKYWLAPLILTIVLLGALLFLTEGSNKKVPIKTMPGIYRYSINNLSIIVDRAIKKKYQ